MIQFVGLIIIIIIDCYVVYTFIKKPTFLKELVQKKDWVRLFIFVVLAAWLIGVNGSWIRSLLH